MPPDKEDNNSIAVIANNVAWIRESFEKFVKANETEHKEIIAQQKETNGSVRDLKNEVFSPSCPADGLVAKVKEQGEIIRKMERSLFRFKVIYPILIAIASIGISQWMEEVLRGTPWTINNLIDIIGKLFGN